MMEITLFDGKEDGIKRLKRRGGFGAFPRWSRHPHAGGKACAQMKRAAPASRERIAYRHQTVKEIVLFAMLTFCKFGAFSVDRTVVIPYTISQC
ncbi:MAG TPA: hypothetical protein IAC19_08230 [Candidatus Ventricola gallistercoris]|nr:hypothetical protein [Candidatus Ventricola gallistercoris]